MIYIPHWLDSKALHGTLVLFFKKIYIPHWLDSKFVVYT